MSASPGPPRPYFVSEGVRSTKPCSSSSSAPLQVQRAARDEHAVAEGVAHAVEGAVERGAPPGLALVEQRALLAAGADEVRERDADAVQRDAAREQARQHAERERQHDRVGVRRAGAASAPARRARRRRSARAPRRCAAARPARARCGRRARRGTRACPRSPRGRRCRGGTRSRARSRAAASRSLTTAVSRPRQRSWSSRPGAPNRRSSVSTGQRAQRARGAHVHRAQRARVRVAHARELLDRQVAQEGLGLGRGRRAPAPSGLTALPASLASMRLGPSPQVTVSPVASRIARLSPRAAPSRSPCRRARCRSGRSRPRRGRSRPRARPRGSARRPRSAKQR